MVTLERLRARYDGRCGYCGVFDEDTGATLTVDHHRPRSHGGGEEEANLVYCCPRCNEHKGAYWHTDAPPGIALLHPGVDDLAVHLRHLDDGRVEGITEEGDFFIACLSLNRPTLVRYRLRQREQRELRATLAAARERVRALEAAIASLTAETIDAEDDLDAEGR